MTVKRNGAEGQTSGTGITTANSAASGDAFAVLTLGSGTGIYDSSFPADGTIGFTFTPSGSTTCFGAMTPPTTTSTCTTEFVYYHDANPPATQRLSTMVSSGGVGVAGIALSTAGKLQVVSSSGTTIATAVNSLTTGHWYRVALVVSLGGTSTTGTALLTYYDGSQSTTPVESNVGSSGAATVGTAQVIQCRWGNCTNVGIAKSVYLDSLQLSDAAALIGPFPGSAATGSATLTFAGTGTAATPGPSGAATVTFAGAGDTAAQAAPSATVTFSGTGSAGVPVLTSAMSAAVGTTTAKVRIDATNTTTATVTAATNTGLTTGVVTSGSVTLDGDGLGVATLTGLTAGTDYFFGVNLNGSLQAYRGKFRTAQTGAYSFSFAAASCMNTPADPAVLDAIRTRTGPTGKTAEFFAHLGDLEYLNANTASTSTILTNYRAVWAKTKHAALAAALPVEYTWSDHDLAGDNCDSTTFVSGGITAYRGTWTRYFPTYDLPASNTDSAPWRSWVRGRVRFIMTDGRTYMSAIAATDNSSKTKLGAAQKAWWKAECLAATAAGQAIVWFHEDGGFTATSAFVGDDTWAAYQTERAELVSYLTSIGGINRILIIHGDFHALAADDGTNFSGIPTACASPMSQTYFMPSQDHWSQGVYPASSPGTTMNQYGWFDVTDTGGTSLTVAFTGYSNDGTSDTSRITLTATLATSTPATASATVTFAGTGGTRAPAGASGTVTFAGTGTSQVPVSGAATVTLSGIDTAAASPAAAATVTFAAASTAKAAVSPAAIVTFAATSSSTAAATGSATVTLAGVGTVTPAGGASAAVTYTGTAVPQASTSGAATVTYAGVGAARIPAAASATVTYAGTGTTGGGSPATGAATITYSGSSAATSAAVAAATVTYNATAGTHATAASSATVTYTGTASTPLSAVASAIVTFTAAGQAYNPDQNRDITLTVTSGPRRWTVTAGTLEGMLT